MVLRYFISLFTILLLLTNTVSAETEKENIKGERIGIIIIGDNEFKTKSYFDRAKKLIKNKNIIVEADEEIQKRANYIKSYSDKTFITDFVKSNNFDKVICLVVNKPIVQSETVKFLSTSIMSAALMRIDIYVYNEENLLKKYSVEKKGLHDEKLINVIQKSIDPEIEAKKAAFSSCIRQIRKEMKDYFENMIH